MQCSKNWLYLLLSWCWFSPLIIGRPQRFRLARLSVWPSQEKSASKALKCMGIGPYNMKGAHKPKRVKICCCQFVMSGLTEKHLFSLCGSVCVATNSVCGVCMSSNVVLFTSLVCWKLSWFSTFYQNYEYNVKPNIFFRNTNCLSDTFPFVRTTGEQQHVCFEGNFRLFRPKPPPYWKLHITEYKQSSNKTDNNLGDPANTVLVFCVY